MSDEDIHAAAERLDSADQKKPNPEGLSVEQAAAKLRERQAGAEAEAGVELPEPELAPMSEEQTETLFERDQRQQLENYRLQLAHEQQRLAEQEQELASLKEFDAAEYAARRWDHEAERQNFNAALQQFQAATNEIQNKDLEQQQKKLLHEQEMLKKKIPNWNSKEADKLTKYLLRQGYSREQITSVTDHKILVAFHQQMVRGSKKSLPQKKLPKAKSISHNDPGLLSDMERRNVSRHTTQGAAERIQALLGG